MRTCAPVEASVGSLLRLDGMLKEAGSVCSNIMVYNELRLVKLGEMGASDVLRMVENRYLAGPLAGRSTFASAPRERGG